LRGLSIGSSVLSGSILELESVEEDLSWEGVVLLAVGNKVEGGVEGEVLGDLEVAVSVEFDDLRIPSVVVDVSPSDLNTDSLPSLNAVVDVPSSVLVG
jgi:hypothetical protein